jgi:hypothetical protein
VRIENRRVFGANRFGNALLHLENLHAGLNEPRFETPDFIRNPGRRNMVTLYFVQIVADDMNPAEGDSG